MHSPIKSWRRQRETRHLLGKEGKIQTWTHIYVGAPSFDQHTPYPVVLVALEGGEHTYGQLVDYDTDDLKTGRTVRSVLRKGKMTNDHEVVEYTIKFKPV